MNRGLLLKGLRETAPVTLVMGMLLALIEAGLAFVLPTFQKQLEGRLPQMKFLQGGLKAVFGSEIDPDATMIGPEVLFSIPWAHPVVLAVLWAHAAVVCTRVPAGEVDRGTADVLLAMPVRRRTIFLSETVVVLSGGLTLLGLAWAGHAIGARFGPADMRPPPERIAMVLLSLLGVYSTAAAFAAWMSALSNRRGTAITLVFIALVLTFLLNYLAQFWDPIRGLAVASVLHYHRPLPILRDGNVSLNSLAVMGLSATVLWLAAGWEFCRRDVSTV